MYEYNSVLTRKYNSSRGKLVQDRFYKTIQSDNFADFRDHRFYFLKNI